MKAETTRIGFSEWCLTEHKDQPTMDDAVKRCAAALGLKCSNGRATETGFVVYRMTRAAKG